MLNDLLLLSGNDIPFVEAAVPIHQPTIKEIAYIGEDKFYMGCEMLTFSKDLIKQEDRIHLTDKSNFDVLMSIVLDKNNTPIMGENKASMKMVLALLFPHYEIKYTSQGILLFDINEKDKFHSINSLNFEKFKEILISMFCLKSSSEDAPDYNPGGELARQIAEKLMKRRQIIAKQKGEDKKKISVLSRYISILSVGEKKDMNDFFQYTVYQLFDEFKRYELKEEYDYIFQARLAGARDLKAAENWKKDLHP